MRTIIELQFPFARIVAWDEPTDDGAEFRALVGGRLIVTPSVALLVSALQAEPPPRVEWSAALRLAA